MDSKHVHVLLEKLGSRKIKVRPDGTWVNGTCPLARWEHAGGRDENPSFGVKVESNGRSHYQCFACGASGDLVQLLFRIMKHGLDVSALQPLVREANFASVEDFKKAVRQVEYWRGDLSGTARQSDSAAPEVPARPQSVFDVPMNVLPDEVLKNFSSFPIEVWEYLTGKRRLSAQTIVRWELAWHATKRRIAIPVRDCAGRLVTVSGRAFDDGVWPPYLHGLDFKKALVLYGEHLLPKAGGLEIGYLVEGFFDAMYLTQKGYPTVAVMGANLSPAQKEKVCYFMKQVVVLPDGDAGGKILADSVLKALSSRIPVRVVDMPAGKDPDELTDEEVQDLL